MTGPQPTIDSRARDALAAIGVTRYGSELLALAEHAARACDELVADGRAFPADDSIEAEEAREPFLAVVQDSVIEQRDPTLVEMVLSCPALWGLETGDGDLLDVCADLLSTLVSQLTWALMGHADRIDPVDAAVMRKSERRYG